MNPLFIKELEAIVGKPHTLSDQESLAVYGYDATPELESRPGVALLPGTAEEIARIMRLCHGAGVSVTPRGSGTNLSGGALSNSQGVLVQTSRLNRIIEVDEENLTATMEPGVITSTLHKTVEERGLFYPPDPGSMNISTMGGNVAENSGGLRGLKYGVTADYVMGLNTVLADGSLLHTGGKVVKDVAGYCLNPLLVSSEGTLGFFTAITVKLIPKPQVKTTMLAHFQEMRQAALAVSAVIAAKIIPATLEFLDKVTIKCVEDYAHVGLPLDVDAVLLIEVDGHPVVVAEEAAGVEAICKNYGCSFFQTARTADEALNLAAARRTALSALARLRPTTILEDATVPRSRIADMLKVIQDAAQKYRVTIGTSGHAGDGNLHPTCPTYRETFLETAAPRGRVALMRKIQEGALDQSETLLEYLSLCLDCQACATACPCGVNAGELVAEFTCERKAGNRLGFMEDLVLRKLLPHPDRLETAMAPMRLYQHMGLQKLVRTLGVLKMFPKPLGRMEGFLPDLPERPLRQVIQEDMPARGETRGTIGFFLGCVMSLIFSEASRATINLLTALGYRVITPKNQVCCGAPHMLAGDKAGLKAAARKNVDIFSNLDVDFIVTDCGGCGAELKKYSQHLEDDSAISFSSKVRDISEVLALHKDELKPLLKPLLLKATFHAHSQGIRKEPRDLIKLVPGLTYIEIENADACCGSAGTYNIGKPEMADLILNRKLDTIRATGADVVVTGNPGCLLQLKKGLSDHLPRVKTLHLTELLARSMDA